MSIAGSREESCLRYLLNVDEEKEQGLTWPGVVKISFSDCTWQKKSWNEHRTTHTEIKFIIHVGKMVAFIVLMSSIGISLSLVSTRPILCTTCIPLETRPNIVCLPSNHCVGANVMKNWLPFVFGPLFAIDNMPAPLKIICKIL